MRGFILYIFAVIAGADLVCALALTFLLSDLQASHGWRWALEGFLALQIVGLVAFVVARLLGYQPGTGMGRPLLSLVMIWNLLFALPSALVYAVWAAVAWLVLRGGPGIGLDSPWRTAGLAVAAIPPALALLATAAAVWQLGRFRVTRRTITIPNLSPALKGLTIAHLSDLHIGKLTRGKILEDMVAATNRLDVDLILLTGDLINMSLDDLPQGFRLLRRMTSRHGLFLCEGNHDLLESRKRFEAAAKASGLSFLFNERATVSVRGQAVEILGLRWGEGMRSEATGEVAGHALDRLLEKHAPGDFTMLLAHHPDAFDQAAAAGIPLTFSGHTHGGQLMLTPKIGFGPWFFRYWSGLYRRGDSQMIVSNGTGNWFPLRINAPAEIIHLTLE